MAQAILCLGGKLAERFTMALRDKQGIIAEASGTFGLVDDGSLDCAAESSDLVAGTRQGNHAPKPRLAVLSADIFEVLQEQCIVLPIRGPFARIPCRIHARSAAKRVDLKAGIVGDDPSIVNLRYGNSLESRIVLEGFARLLDFRGCG